MAGAAVSKMVGIYSPFISIQNLERFKKGLNVGKMWKDVKLAERNKTVEVNQNAKWENIHSRTQKEKVQEKKT